VLGQILFKKCGLNDSLLLSTLLSTSLVNLKQKGFPVDRIISAKIKKRNANQPKPITSASNSGHGSTENITEPTGNMNNSQKTLTNSESRTNISKEDKDTQNNFNQLNQLFPNIDTGFLLNFIKSQDTKNLQQLCNKLMDMDNDGQLKNLMKPQSPPPTQPHPQNTTNIENKPESKIDSEMDNKMGSNDSLEDNNKSGSHQSLTKSKLNKFTRNLIKGWKSNPSSKSSSENSITEELNGNMPGGFTPDEQNIHSHHPTPQPIKEITPDYTKNLKQNLEKAIDLCHSSDDRNINTHIRNPDAQSVEHFRPALQDQCSIIQANQLTQIGSLVDVNIYVEKTIPQNEIRTLISQELIQAFIVDVLLPLGNNVFNLKSKTIHVYYDQEGNVVAFNRQRTLFFNLRYFKGLHYENQFENKETKVEALIYW